MTQPDWAEIIAQMTPEQQAEVRRIADKLTYILTHDRLISDYLPQEPDKSVAFRKFKGGDVMT
jgi:DNA-directed RNA polymerase subunit F